MDHFNAGRLSLLACSAAIPELRTDEIIWSLFAGVLSGPRQLARQEF